MSIGVYRCLSGLPQTKEICGRPDRRRWTVIDTDSAEGFPDVVSPVLFLAVDLPPPQLFQDSVERNIIPRVSIHSVLAKYDGRTTQESAGQLRRCKWQRLPLYIILHFKQFPKNAFAEEKNLTIVNFPLRGFDFRDYVDASPSNESTVYDLIANVTHESVAGTIRDKENTVWKAHLRAAGGGDESEKWFMIQDLSSRRQGRRSSMGRQCYRFGSKDPMNRGGVSEPGT